MVKRRNNTKNHTVTKEIIIREIPAESIFTAEELDTLLVMAEGSIECHHDCIHPEAIKGAGVEEYSFSEEEILDAHQSLGSNICLYFKLRKLRNEFDV